MNEAPKSGRQGESAPSSPATFVPRKSFRRQAEPPEVVQALELFKRNPGDAIELLIEAELLEDNCSAVAKWLFEREDVDKASLGLFLSRDKNWNTAILESFVELFDFHDLEFDSALRRFLFKFRLPGEAQKIDRLMDKFAVRYYAQNATWPAPPLPNTPPAWIPTPLFANKDAIYVLAFSIIMLNTDAHNPAIKKANKMTKAQFIRNVSGINDGADFPDRFLSELYDRIVTNEIKMETEADEEASGKSPRGRKGSVSGGGPGGSGGSAEFKDAELKGYLMKQGGKVKTWKRRWFVLDGNCLFYFEGADEKDPLGIIPLENLVVNPATSSKRRYSFMLQNPNEGPIKATVRKGSSMVVGNHENYVFQAANEQEFSLWLDSLNRNIFRNPFYLLLANKKKQLEAKGKGASALGTAAISASPSLITVSSQSSAKLFGSHSSQPASSSASNSPSSSRKNKSSTSSAAGIQRNESIFVKVSPPGSPTSPSQPPPSSSKAKDLAPSSSKASLALETSTSKKSSKDKHKESSKPKSPRKEKRGNNVPDETDLEEEEETTASKVAAGAVDAGDSHSSSGHKGSHKLGHAPQSQSSATSRAVLSSSPRKDDAVGSEDSE